MKKLLKLSILLLLFVPLQKAVGQGSIIMGSAGSSMFVGGIDENPIYFYDPGGIPGQPGANNDPNGYFDQGLCDTITLRTNSTSSKLYVLFEEFVVGPGDTLWIFDGSSVNSPLFGDYNLARSPGELTATGREMTFVFHSDSVDITGLMKGWQATVYEYFSDPEEINYGDRTAVVTCNALFFDSGGPSQNIIPDNGTFTQYTEFTSPVGTYIKCEFTEFQVNGILKIYDGQYLGNDKRLIGQFHSSTLDSYTNSMPPLLFSSSNTLSFVYVGGSGDANKSGWRAEISCVPEIVETPIGNTCPEVINTPGGDYVNSGEVIEFNCGTPVVVLEAKLEGIPGRYANDYKVEHLSYNENEMLFNYNEGDPIPWPASVTNRDDKWCAPVPLPFTFTFFGRPYTTVYPSANGVISFNPQTAWSGCAWSTSIPQASPPYDPNNTPYNYANCAYLLYEDIDPEPSHCSLNDAIRYGVLGEEPCRAFVFNYKNIGLYDCCSSGAQYYNTYQMVLYEGTNIIDVYIKKRNNCSWNGYRGVIGLQNKTSSQILTAPGRDFNQVWTTENEHWRFTPISPKDQDAELTWYYDTVDQNHILSYDPHAKNTILTHTPTDTTMYISEYKYRDANDTLYIRRDTTYVNVNIPKITPISSNGNTPVCPGDSVFLSVEIDTTLHIDPALYGGYAWSSSKADTFAIDTVFAPVAPPNDTATYYVTVTFDNYCTRDDSVKVAVTKLVMPTTTGRLSVTDTDSICYGESYTLKAMHPSTNNFKWSTVADTTVFSSTDVITVSPKITTDYVATATMPGACLVSDTFTVVVMPLPVPSFVASPTEIFVENGVGTVYCSNDSIGKYPHLVWNFGDHFSSVNIIQDIDEPTHDYTRSGFYTITMTATDSFGCVDSVKRRVSVEVPYFFYIPNAFTPDGDGQNETFAPAGEGVDPDNYSMQIFDRSGVLIYSTRNPYDYWDGRNKYGQMCPEGVYVYKINLFNLNGEDKEYRGTVTLVK